MPALLVPTDAELEELARTLETQEIPSKLRCGICDLLAFNTLRLPCCSTNICDKCYENEVSEECIICCHKPLDKTLCEPNKPMRITIKALLKRKFNDRAKKQNEAAKAQPVEIVKEKTDASENDTKESNPMAENVNDEVAVDIPVATVTDLPAIQTQVNEVSTKDEVEDHNQIDVPTSPTDDDTEVEIIIERAPDKISHENATNPSTSTTNSNFSGPGQTNGMNGMNNMNQINGMNGMLPMDFASMMAAASSMMPMAGMPNMMGLGMVPAMAQMFGGFDNSNMSMNGMNMGGMDSFQNQYSNGGNETWMNNTQGNFGNNAYGNSNFGGYAGYNNYNQMNEQAYANNDFYRGYGRQGFANRRGRRGYYNGGGYGRGSYNQGNNSYNGHANQDQLYPQQSNQNASEAIGVDEHKTASASQNHDATLQASFAPGGEHDFDAELGHEHADTDQHTSEQTSINSTSIISKETESTKFSEDVADEARSNRDNHAPDVHKELEKAVQAQVSEDATTTHDEPRPIQAFLSDEPQSQPVPPLKSNIPTGPGSRSTSRAPFTSDSAPINSPIEPRGIGVIGAPTGPRALREGLPNTGRSGFRYGQVSKPAVASPVVSEHPQNSSVTETKYDSVSVASRNKSLSPKRRPSTNHRSRRHDSISPSREVEENGHVEKHRERSRKYTENQADYEEERPSRSSRHKHGDYTEDEEVSHKTKHRSRRHKDEDTDLEDREQRPAKRSHRDRDDYEDDRRHHSSKRSRRHHDEDTGSSSRKRHRERSRSPEHHDSDRDRHSSRREHQEERPSRKRSHEDPEVTSTSTHGPEYPEDHSYSKRRPSTYSTTEDTHHESKRSRHETNLHRSTTSTHESSKPNTPLTATFPAKPTNHRASNASNDPRPMLKQIPTGPRGSTNSQDRDRIRQPVRTTTSDSKPAPTNAKDPHTLEREARDRERLQREMQRRAFMDVNGAAAKRKGPPVASARRLTYRFEDEGGADVKRGEREREAGRW